MKKQYVIEGGVPLNGTIQIQGSKNSSLAILVGSILCKDKVTLYNVPNISDVRQCLRILKYLNCQITTNGEKIEIDSSSIQYKTLLIEEVKKFRASYYFIGAFLSLFGKVEVYQPGGCNIGQRPIDQHIKGFQSLKANFSLKNQEVRAEAKELFGDSITLDIASVGATINIILASLFANGKTILKNGAKEPEIIDFITFLKTMGASIIGEGKDYIVITPNKKLHGCEYHIMPDRIVSGTYLLYGALLSDRLTLTHLNSSDLISVLTKLIEMGVHIDIRDHSLTIYGRKQLKNIVIQTGIYPSFPSDLQQIMSVLLFTCSGVSIIEEALFENRFTHLEELKKMGARYLVMDNKALIIPSPFYSSEVACRDLRGGAALLLAALYANGKTVLKNVEFIERGYENIVFHLKQLHAVLVEEEYEEA